MKYLMNRSDKEVMVRALNSTIITYEEYIYRYQIFLEEIRKIISDLEEDLGYI